MKPRSMMIHWDGEEGMREEEWREEQGKWAEKGILFEMEANPRVWEF
jgi:hypothetical protein